MSSLEDEVKRAQQAAKAVKAKAKLILSKVSLDTVREVKRAMPVDTGRARASWGKWDDGLTPGHQVLKHPHIPASVQKQLAAAGPADAIYLEEDDGMKITQGSNLEYIEVLNAGHSQQAPAGFLDVIAQNAELTIDAALAALVDAL